MSQFYANIQGNRGETTRQGTKKSGLVAHVRGWNIGIRVHCFHDKGKDHVRVFKTSGSNYTKSDEVIAEITE